MTLNLALFKPEIDADTVLLCISTVYLTSGRHQALGPRQALVSMIQSLRSSTCIINSDAVLGWAIQRLGGETESPVSHS